MNGFLLQFIANAAADVTNFIVGGTHCLGQRCVSQILIMFFYSIPLN